MKRLIFLLSLLIPLMIYGQNTDPPTVLEATDKPLLLDEPGNYLIDATNYTRTDSGPVWLMGSGLYDLSGSKFEGNGFRSFVSLPNRQFFGGSQNWPSLIMKNVVMTADTTNLPRHSQLPFILDAGSANIAGLRSLVVEHCEFYHTAGLRWKRGPSDVVGKIAYNYFATVDGRISDGNGGWMTRTQAIEETGTPGAQWTRHAVTMGRLFEGPVKDVDIIWNLIINETPAQEDMINIAFDVDRSTIVKNPDGYVINSGGFVGYNLVRGNYKTEWWREDQSGCTFIYDNQQQLNYGGALFIGNYSINGSNAPFTHAVYGPGYWRQNVAVGSGYFWGTDRLIAYCSRGFGLYHGNVRREISTDIVFSENLSGYMNTRFGYKRLDYSMWRAGGLEYEFEPYVFSGPYANKRINEGQNITHEDELFYENEYYTKAEQAGIVFGLTDDVDPPPPPSGGQCDSLTFVIVELQGQIRGLESQVQLLTEQNTTLTQQVITLTQKVSEVETENGLLKLQNQNLTGKLEQIQYIIEN